MKSLVPCLKESETDKSMVDLMEFHPLPTGDRQFSPSFCRRFGALKLKEDRNDVWIGQTQPAFRGYWERFFPEKNIHLMRIGRKELDVHLQEDDPPLETEGEAADTICAVHSREASGVRKQPGDSRVLRWLVEGFRRGADEIHIESFHGSGCVRFRRDGIFFPGEKTEPRDLLSAEKHLLSMAGINRAEGRRPAEGRISIRYEEKLREIRVSLLPARNGFSLVLLLKGNRSNPRSLEHLGLNAETLEAMKSVMASRHGVFLVAGPRGSGKTTTLKALLGHMNPEALKILTFDAPAGIRESSVVQVRSEADGIPISESLGSEILRQNPDVLLIDEIRHRETALLAFETALQGGLVLSSILAPNGNVVPPQLIDLGLPAHLVAVLLKGVLSQRLLRSLCPICRGADRRIGPAICPFCSGRGISELRLIGEYQQNRQRFGGGGDFPAWLRHWRGHSRRTLREEAKRLVEAGIVPSAELRRQDIQ